MAFVGLRSEVTSAHITDGLSHTFFAGEKFLNPFAYTTGDDDGDNGSMYQGNDYDINRWCRSWDQPREDTPGYHTVASFGSAHASGLNFVMCDGSVQTISYSINGQVYENLGNRSDGAADSDQY